LLRDAEKSSGVEDDCSIACHRNSGIGQAIRSHVRGWPAAGAEEGQAVMVKCHICGDDMPLPDGITADDAQRLLSVGGKFVCGVCADVEGIKGGPIEDSRLNKILKLEPKR
jgi:hypothetical protein